MRVICLVPVAAILVLRLASAKSIDSQYSDNVMLTTIDQNDNNQTKPVNDYGDVINVEGENGRTETFQGLGLGMPIWVAVLISALLLICCFCCMRCAMDYDMIKTRHTDYRTPKWTVVEIVRQIKLDNKNNT